MNRVLLLKWVAHSRICSNPLSNAQESREKLSDEEEELKIWSWNVFSIVGLASQSEGVGTIYSPHTFITVRGVRTLDISDLDRICSMGDSNWLEFDWVGSIQCGSDISIQGRMQRFWNPLKAEQIRWVKYIRPEVGYVRLGQLATVLEPDRDQIYPTWHDCHSSGTRWKYPIWSDISDDTDRKVKWRVWKIEHSDIFINISVVSLYDMPRAKK
jgi:hypothetical protein